MDFRSTHGQGQPWACTDWVGGAFVYFAGGGTANGRINDWYAPASWSSWTPYTGVPGTVVSWGSPGSLHVGGMQVLMGDGAVRFISENISTVTMNRLGYIADGQVVGEF